MYRKLSGRKKSSKVGRTTKRRSTRRRRISGASDISGMALQAGGLVLGAVGGRELNTLGVKMFGSNLTPTMSGLAQVVAGFVLPRMVKGPFWQAVGNGMVANGGMVLVVSTGIVQGTNDRAAYRLNGTSRLSVVNGINGTGNLDVVNGPTTRISAQPNGQVVPRVSVQKFNHLV